MSYRRPYRDGQRRFDLTPQSEAAAPDDKSLDPDLLFVFKVFLRQLHLDELVKLCARFRELGEDAAAIEAIRREIERRS